MLKRFTNSVAAIPRLARPNRFPANEKGGPKTALP